MSVAEQQYGAIDDFQTDLAVGLSSTGPPEAAEDGESCTACMSNPRTVRNLPCGHAMLCELCTITIIDPQSKSCMCPLSRCDVTSLKFLPSTNEGNEPRVARMSTYKSTASHFSTSEVPVVTGTSVVPGGDLAAAEAEAGARTFATLLEFLQAMLDSESEEVVAAAHAKLERWEVTQGQRSTPLRDNPPQGQEEPTGTAPGMYPIDQNGNATVPYGMAILPSGAFDGCTSLNTITLPASLTTIGGSAFRGCTSLTTITLPTRLATIGDRAFANCTSLATITWPQPLNDWASIGNFAFSGCNRLTFITLPYGLTRIGNRAFENCDRLSLVILPDSLTTIGDNAFAGCDSLTTILPPERRNQIGTNSFGSAAIRGNARQYAAYGQPVRAALVDQRSCCVLS